MMRTQSGTMTGKTIQQWHSELPLPLSHDEWQNTFDCMPDLIAILDTEHRIVRANRAMRQKLEQDGHSIVGEHCYRLLHNLDAPLDDCIHVRMLKDGSSHVEETHLPGLNGDYTVSVTPLLDAAGTLTGSIHIAHDVTLRKQAEDALRESEELLREAQLVAGLGTYCFDIVNGSWSSSEIMDSIFGIDKAYDRSLTGWASLIHPKERDSMLQYLTEKVLGKHQRFDREYRIIRADDGRELWVHGLGRLEFNQQGQPVRMIGTILDVTRQKLGEETLRASEEKFRLLFEKSNDAIFISSPDGSVISANPEACRMFRMSADELRHAGRSAIIDPADDRFTAAFEIRGRTGEFNGELNFVKKNGEVFPADVSSSIFTDSAGTSRATVRIRDISERKLAEQVLKETNERFMELMETVPTVAVQGYELDGTVIYWNKASETLYGYSSGEALGANLLGMIIPPEMRAGVRQAIQQMKETGVPIPAGELTLLRKDGSRVPVHSSHALVETGESHPVLFCLDIDLSERKDMEEKLRHASDEWRETFDNIPDMITILDSEHRIVRANRAAWQKLGCEVQDLLGQPCYTLYHRLGAPPGFCPHTQLLQDGRVHSVEIIEPRLNCCVDVTVTPLFGPDGKVTGSIHVAHDITGLKRADKALRESEALYRSILTASPDDITITDLEGTIRMVSPKGLAMFGYEREEALLCRSIVDFIAPEDRERTATDLMHMYQGTFSGPGEYRAIRADGSLIMVEINGAFILDTAGRPESMIFAIRDVSERKRVAAELNKKNIEIEQFIYTVSHDLRSPLVTVKTFLGYLEQDISTGDSDRVVKDIEFIHTAADRMETLLNELLDMSRVGRAATTLEEVTFQELASAGLDAVAGQISKGRVDIRVSAANPTLHGDRRRLLQIWQNLLDNALKYMGDQALPLIEIGIEQQKGETVFFVCDNGIGIAPAYHEKVFGIFEKLDLTIGGVGMGLTMVKRIVETYGGRIWVESKGDGTGSCFRFTLPGMVGNSKDAT